LWFGKNILQLGLPDTVFAGNPLLTPELLSASRGVWHDATPFISFIPPLDPALPNPSLVTLSDRAAATVAVAQPSPSPTFELFTISQVPRYRDGWARLQRFFLFPVSFLDFTQAGSRWTPPIEPITLSADAYRLVTQKGAPPSSLFGYFSVPASPAPLPPSDPLALRPFYTVLNTGNPLVFRGIYVDNISDVQFLSLPTVDVDGDGDLDPVDINGDGDVNDVDQTAFNDRNDQFRSELAQVYDWMVRPIQAVPDPNNPGQFLPSVWRRLFDSGWMQDNNPNADRNLIFERNAEETLSAGQYVPVQNRAMARLRYVPPGVQVFIEVIPDPQSPDPSRPDLFQRIYLVRHDRNSQGQRSLFRDGSGNVLSDDPNTPVINEGARLVFVDRIRRTALHQNPLPTVVLFAEGNVRISGTYACHLIVFSMGTIYVEGPLVRYRDPRLDNDADGRIDEDPVNGLNDDRDGSIDEDPVVGIDDDADGRFDEDLPNGRDDDGDGRIDEDPADYGSCQLLARQNLAVNGTALLPLLTRLTPDDVRATAPIDLRAQGEGDFSRVLFSPPTGVPDQDLDGRVDRSGMVLWDFPSLPLSREALAHLSDIRDGLWSVRLVFIHRGRVQDTEDPWTNLKAVLRLSPGNDQNADGSPDDDGDGRVDEEEPNGLDDDADGLVDEDSPKIVVLYGPDEPKRTFPVTTNWYSDQEWGIWDIPIPPSAFDLNNDGVVDPVRELKPALESPLQVRLESPVAGEIVPPGREYVPYEIGGLSIRLQDQNGAIRPLWEWKIQALGVAERGTVGIIGPPFLDQTDEVVAAYGPNPANQPPQWRSYSWWADLVNGVVWKREWAARYLRGNQVSILWEGSLCERVTAPTMLARLSLNLARPWLLFRNDKQLDRLATTHPNPEIFLELPHFVYDRFGLFDDGVGTWRFRRASFAGLLYRAPVVPRLPVSPDLFVSPSQVGPD
ncbi:MAG: hypothetical protein RMK62_08045, partial [Armatimonadota bacterium]|nr:hypothetical protein [Armatimonadota bacterium]